VVEDHQEPRYVYRASTEKGEVKMTEDYYEPPVEEKKSNRTLIIIIVVVVALIVLCCCCVLAILTLAGPAVGNVFSNIIEGLEMTPMP
jgi:lipopolysaccharide/colanic/teichoic acid biosynthesis glycosyltransferase